MAALTFAPPSRPLVGVRDGSRLVVQTWLITRLLLVAVALWVGKTTGRSASDMLANWDVQHYFEIARHGYAADNDIAFFPGWPLVLRAFASLGVPMLWAGVGLAMICSAFAAAALYRLGGPIAAVVWLLAPTTVFTMVPYTEAPFCAAAFWAWERARAGRWGAAAGLAAIACTLRVSGLFLLGALVILALTSRRSGGWPGVHQGGQGGQRWTSASGQPGVAAGSRARAGAPSGRSWLSWWPWPGRRVDAAASGQDGEGRGWFASRGVDPGGVGRGEVSPRGIAGGGFSGGGFSWGGAAQSGFPADRRTSGGQGNGSSTDGAGPLARVAASLRLWWTGDRARALAWLSIPAATLFAYMFYLYRLTGDWNAWYRAQSTGWPRGFTWPWVSLQHTLEAAASKAYPAFPEWSWVFRAELAAMAIGVIVTLICLRKHRWAEAAWVGVQVLAFSCSYWYLSVTRAVLLWFPLFVLLGERLSGGWTLTPGRRRLRMVVTAIAIAAAGYVLCWWGWLFFTGRWAS